MKTFFYSFILISSLSVRAQSQESVEVQRRGFIFGTAFGASSLQLNTTSLVKETQYSISFPNFKIGSMISNRSAVVLYLPGSIYRYKSVGRERDRGFEGIIPSYQYWMNNRWWILSGVGLCLDAPAFYDIKSEDERKFYFGPSIITAVGYEVWSKGKFALDVQGRINYGYSNIPEGRRSGLAVNVMVGFNWY